MRFLFFLFFIFFGITLSAQLQEATLSHNPILAKTAENRKEVSTNNRSRKSVPLPFFDDFATASFFPNPDLWENQLVFINNTLANQPVSVGVATFDGLDGTGSPYGGGFGSADTLTSISLDLSGNAAKFLSYYVQPKGLGDAPGMEDRLVLEFKNSNGDWIEIREHAVTFEDEALFPVDSIPTFEFIGPIVIEDAQYLHDDFQFRFRNFALRNGAVDLWHLDYVRLEAEPMSQINDDLAFTTLPSNIFFNYSSIPWLHLIDEQRGDIIRTEVDVNVFNHASGTRSTNESELEITGINDDNVTAEFRRQSLLASGSTSFSSGFQQTQNEIRGNYVRAYFSNFLTDDRIRVKVDYSFENNEATNFRQNNQVSRTFDLDNFYAYDDNSAESAYFVGTGGQVAVRFTNLKADLLQAIRLQIPRIVAGDISTTNFTLRVWLDDINTDPIFEQPFTNPLFIDDFVDSLQAFTTYVLRDEITGEPTPVQLPIGDFYIGWQQVSSCGNERCLPVGFDRNTPSATENILLNVDGDWRSISSFFIGGIVPPSQQGAIMIRPVVGSEPPNDSETVSTTELALPQIMNIFPNPTSGQLNIELFEGNYSDFQIQIFNTLGQQIKQQTLSRTIDLSEQNTGVYILQFIDQETGAMGNYKLVLKK